MRGDMMETYKFMSGKYDADVSNIMPKTNESATNLYNWRHSKKPFLQRAEKRIGQIFFSICVTNYWNSLPASMTETPSNKVFE